MAFWEEFEERFGRVGMNPRAYYCFEVGHILHVLPNEVGYLTPGDLLAALNLFDVLYRNEG